MKTAITALVASVALFAGAMTLITPNADGSVGPASGDFPSTELRF